MRVIENPVSGEQIVIRTSGADTGGTLLVFDLRLPHHAHVPARHRHPSQEETFTVLSGRMRFRIGSTTRMAMPGDVVRVAPGTPHWFGNAGEGDACARVAVRPALRLEEFFVATEAMGRAGHLPGTRLPHLSDLALLLLDFQDEVVSGSIPGVVVRAVLALPAWFGRRRAQRRRECAAQR